MSPWLVMRFAVLLACAAVQVAAVAAPMPAEGTRWRYSFKDQQYPSRRQFYSITAVHVDGAFVSELLTVEGGDIKESIVEAGQFRFEARPLNEVYNVLELAPYGLDNANAVQGKVPAMYPRLRDVDWKVAPAELAEEQLTVPAGTFRTIRVRVTGEHPAFGMAPQDAMSRPGRFEYTVWYAPDVSRCVKIRHRLWDRAHLPVGDQVSELVSYEPTTRAAKPVAVDLPSAGSTWKYGYADARAGGRRGYFTVEAAAVQGGNVRERWTGEGGEIIEAEVDARTASFVVKKVGTATVLELSPYTRDPAGLARAAISYPDEVGGQWSLDPAKSSEESTVVQAGTFRAVRVDLSGTTAVPSASTLQGRPWRFAYSVWYAPELKRYVKIRHQTWNRFGTVIGDETVQLIEYQPGRVARPAAPAVAPAVVAVVTPPPSAPPRPLPPNTSIVLNVAGSEKVEGYTDWDRFKSEWGRQFLTVVSQRGGRFSMQSGAPVHTGQPGTLVVLQVNDYRYVGWGARFEKNTVPGRAQVDATARFLDLQTGAQLGERKIEASFDGAGFTVSATQLRELAEQLVERAAVR